MPQTHAAEAAIRFWRDRQASKENYFLYYEHGKSVVRCDTSGCCAPRASRSAA